MIYVRSRCVTSPEAVRVDGVAQAWIRPLESKLDQSIDDDKEVRARMGRLEAGLADVQRQLAEQSVRMDRTSTRLERIERRFGPE